MISRKARIELLVAACLVLSILALFFVFSSPSQPAKQEITCPSSDKIIGFNDFLFMVPWNAMWMHFDAKSPDYFNSPFFKTFAVGYKNGAIHPISAYYERGQIVYKISMSDRVETVTLSPNDSTNVFSTIKVFWFRDLVRSAAEKGRKDDFIFAIKA